MGRLKKMKQLTPYTIQLLLLAGLIYLTQGESKLIEGYVIIVKFLNGLAWGVLAAIFFYGIYAFQEANKTFREGGGSSIADKVLVLQEQKSTMKKISKLKESLLDKKFSSALFRALTLSQILMLGYHGFYIPACIGALLLIAFQGLLSEVKKFDEVTKI